MNKKTLFCCLLAILISFPALFGAQVNLSNSSSKTEWPAVAVNAAGDVMVVWTEWEGKGNIYYRIYKNGQWSAKQNAGIVHEWAWSNMLEVDSQGMFHLTYADGWGSTTRDIYYSYYNGSRWTSSERIYRSAHNSAWNKMDMDTDNRIYVAWYHKYYNPPAVSDVVVSSKPKGGTWPSEYENVSRKSSTESIHPAIAARGGKVYVCYMDGGSGNWPLRFSEKSGGSWSSPITVVPLGYYPAMVADGGGNLHIAYSNRSSNFFVVSRNGGKWGSPVAVSNGNAPLQFGDIRYHNNALVAAWVQSSGSNYYVYSAMKLTGSQWSPPVRVSNGDNIGDGNKHVQVAIDNQGYAHFVWEGEGAGGREDVFYNRIGLADVDAPFIETSTYFLEFSTDRFENTEPKTFQLRNAGEDTLSYTISTNKTWLSATPTSGTSSGEWDTVTVSVNPGSMQAGTYSGTVTITAPEAFNSPYLLDVSLTVEEKAVPHIQLDKNFLPYTAFANGDDPKPEYFNVRNIGADNMSYSIVPTASWIKVTPSSGSSTGEWDKIKVHPDITGLGVGWYTGEIKVKASQADNSPQKLTVSLNVQMPPRPYPPINVKMAKFSHEGLMMKIYKNKLTWNHNTKNQGLFTIDKFLIFRRLKDSYDYKFLEAVPGTVRVYEDDDFTSAAERDKYRYAVACMDVHGRESYKNETASASSGSVHDSVDKVIQSEKEKKHP